MLTRADLEERAKELCSKSFASQGDRWSATATFALDAAIEVLEEYSNSDMCAIDVLAALRAQRAIRERDAKDPK